MAGTLARPQAGGRMWLDIPHSPLPSETLGYQPSHASPQVSRGGIAVFVGTPDGTPPKTRRLKAEPTSLSAKPSESFGLAPLGPVSRVQAPAPLAAAFNMAASLRLQPCSGLGGLPATYSTCSTDSLAAPKMLHRQRACLCTFIAAFNS